MNKNWDGHFHSIPLLIFGWEIWDKGKIVYEDSELVSEVIDHRDREQAKAILLKRFLRKIKQFGGRNITVKDKGPVDIGIKYTMRKEVILPVIIVHRDIMVCSLFPLHSSSIYNKHIHKEKNKKAFGKF